MIYNICKYSQLRKYKRVLEHIRKIPFYEKEQTGSGIRIFSDPSEMVERLDILIASKNAGNHSIEVLSRPRNFGRHFHVNSKKMDVVHALLSL
jgi:hypothetical protein